MKKLEDSFEHSEEQDEQSSMQENKLELKPKKVGFHIDPINIDTERNLIDQT